MPNATTGISPYMLVYGRLPRGPLAVLKESWSGQRDVRADLGKPVEEYMGDLRRRLKSAADWAALHAKHGQEIYVLNYNLRSRDKHFDEGDTVIVLNDEAYIISDRVQRQCCVLNHHTVILLILAMDAYVICMLIRCENLTYESRVVM